MLGDNSTKLPKYFWCINEKVAIFLGAEKTGKVILIEFSILDRTSNCSSQNLANIFDVDENLIVDESNIDILRANYTYSLPENMFENNGLNAKVATHMYFCKEADKGRFVELYTAEDIENKL